MTCAADLGVRIVRGAGIETGTMRADAEGTELRMALHAVSLRVAGNAGLEGLPRRLSVAQQPDGLRVVVPRSDIADDTKPHLQVAVPAEQLGAVTGRAVEPTSPCLRRMTHGPAGQMVCTPRRWRLRLPGGLRRRVRHGTGEPCDVRLAWMRQADRICGARAGRVAAYAEPGNLVACVAGARPFRRELAMRVIEEM
jgi:hypothetical protein